MLRQWAGTGSRITSTIPSFSTHLAVIIKYNTRHHLNRLLLPCIASFQSPVRTISSCPDRGTEDYHRYTSGRWLWDEDSQLSERYKRFNVSELKKISAQTVGAQTCVSMIKLAEGGFNKVFRLAMDDGTIVLARIPNPNAGPPFKTTASEVATMDFVSWHIIIEVV